MTTRPPIMLTVMVDNIPDGYPIPERFARCAQDGKGATRDSDNIRPTIRWSGAPGTTKSYAIIVVDRDVPASFESANQPGKIIPADLPRRNFYHWVQADIPANVNHLPEGQAGKVASGISGQNDFGARGKDRDIGYDGPCPPWNDERLHHYHFMVYALDVPSLGLKGAFTGQQMEDAMQGHILAGGEVIATYTTNQKKKHAA